MAARYDTEAIVVGGGIGGLAATVALARAGMAVTVCERAPALAPAGFALTLWGNALHALDRLGLGDAVRARAQPQTAGGICTPDGRPLVRLSLEGLAAVAVRRSDLQQVLRAALPPDALCLGRACVAVAQDARGVRAHFADGSHLYGRLLVGADGLRSAVRAALFGDHPPRYAGYTAWRGVARFPHDDLLPGETWGCGARFGQVALPGGEVYWFAVANAPEGADGDPAAWKEYLLAHFGTWHAPIPALIRATADASIGRSDIYDRPPLPHWSVGRITLLGDAAHPMTPNLGQGACQALEDAAALGRCLVADDDPVAALQAYEARRMARAYAIVRQSRYLGQIGQWRHPLACRARNVLMRRIPARVHRQQFARITGYAV